MRFQTIVFDFDSTVAAAEGFDLLAEEALRGRDDAAAILQQFQEITNLGMTGAIPFDESLRRRMQLVSLNKAHIDRVVATMPERTTRSFIEHKAFFDTHGNDCYIVSGGFSDLIYPAADLLGIPRLNVFANAFIFDDAGNVVGIDMERPTSRAGGKAAQIYALAVPRPAVMVGDGMTDYDAKKHGGVDAFIAYTEHARRDKVVALADGEARSFAELLTLVF
jgi:D-3-phosphoglycerate dehydrogenase